MKSWRDNIFFILIEPKEPGNIGASARAMKDMGFKNLELVKPVRYLTEEARSMACDAIDVLDQAAVYPDLRKAIEGKSLVIGPTRRLGRRRGLIIPLKESLKRIVKRVSARFSLTGIPRCRESNLPLNSYFWFQCPITAAALHFVHLNIFIDCGVHLQICVPDAF